MEIKLYCSMDVSKVNSLRKHIESLTELYYSGGKTCFTGVVITADDALERSVNKLIKETKGELENYKFGSYAPDGVAVPIEVNSKLLCFVVLTKNVVKQMHNEQLEALSTLYEELLHIKFYTLGWNETQRQTPYTGLSFEAELFKASGFLLDEYCVGRTKVPIIAKRFNRILSYGGDLLGAISRAGIEFNKNKLSLEDLFIVTIRSIFEPLTRDATYKDANPLEFQGNDKSLLPENSSFYRKHVSSFWVPMHEEMDRFFQTQVNREQSIEKIADIIKNFIQSI